MHWLWKWTIIGGCLLVTFFFISCMAIVGMYAGGSSSPTGCLETQPAQAVAAVADTTQWDEEQREIAGLIIGIGRERGFSDRDIKIALMVAMQEAKLRNPKVATDHDSLGVYQQRPSQGWGTPQQIVDPVYAINKFYDVLATVDNRDAQSLLDVALAVQNPSRKAYLSSNNYFPGWEDEADALLAGSGAVAPVVTGVRQVVCEQALEPEVAQVASDWQLPLRDPYRLTSGFGSRIDPVTGERGAFHDGLDFAAPAGTPIYAIADGVVIEVRVTAVSNGWGNTVVIDHGQVKTRYAHMQHQPAVQAGAHLKAGDTIGEVGMSGKSTGNHLHLALYEGGTIEQRSSGPVYVPGEAIDPVSFLQEKGLKP